MAVLMASRRMKALLGKCGLQITKFVLTPTSALANKALLEVCNAAGQSLMAKNLVIDAHTTFAKTLTGLITEYIGKGEK